MDKTYICKNGTIRVTTPETCDRGALKKATEDFLKKVISGGIKNGYNHSSTNFRKK